jgi:hypothetical protein
MDNSLLSQNIQSLDFTLQEIQNLYDANVAEFSEKYLIFLNAKSSFLNDLVYFVHGNLEQENLAISRELNDLKDRNGASILEAKEQVRLEKQAMETKLKEALQQKVESFATQELMKEKYETLKQQRDIEDEKNHASIRELKDALQKKVEQHMKEKDDFEEKLHQMQRNNVKSESEFEKERALME